MSQNFYGSICVTDLIEKAKDKHSAFVKGSNGKIYCNISVWLNDTPDAYKNVMSLLLSSQKELREREGKVYIGNCKKSEFQEPQRITDSDANSISEEISDLPF
jgi:hypothetical protein